MLRFVPLWFVRRLTSSRPLPPAFAAAPAPPGLPPPRQPDPDKGAPPCPISSKPDARRGTGPTATDAGGAGSLADDQATNFHAYHDSPGSGQPPRVASMGNTGRPEAPHRWSDGRQAVASVGTAGASRFRLSRDRAGAGSRGRSPWPGRCVAGRSWGQPSDSRRGAASARGIRQGSCRKQSSDDALTS